MGRGCDTQGAATDLLCPGKAASRAGIAASRSATAEESAAAGCRLTAGRVPRAKAGEGGSLPQTRAEPGRSCLAADVCYGGTVHPPPAPNTIGALPADYRWQATTFVGREAAFSRTGQDAGGAAVWRPDYSMTPGGISGGPRAQEPQSGSWAVAGEERGPGRWQESSAHTTK